MATLYPRYTYIISRYVRSSSPLPTPFLPSPTPITYPTPISTSTLSPFPSLIPFPTLSPHPHPHTNHPTKTPPTDP